MIQTLHQQNRIPSTAFSSHSYLKDISFELINSYAIGGYVAICSQTSTLPPNHFVSTGERIDLICNDIALNCERMIVEYYSKSALRTDKSCICDPNLSINFVASRCKIRNTKYHFNVFDYFHSDFVPENHHLRVHITKAPTIILVDLFGTECRWCMTMGNAEVELKRIKNNSLLDCTCPGVFIL